MKIKICGITTKEDARAAVDAGADEIGFNFYPESPRYVTPSAAADIAESLPGEVSRVGVFVDEDPFLIAEIAHEVDLDAIQLHGYEDRETCEKVRHLSGALVIKAISGADRPNLEKIADFRADALLVDAIGDSERGGTGQVFDWDAAGPIFERFEKVYVAGGLDANNVAEAIETLEPFAVDVCSGVESRPGIKDEEKLKEFVQNAREAAHEEDGN